MYVELDSLIWDEDWKEVSDAELQNRLSRCLNGKDNFVVEGVLINKLSEEFMESLTDIIYLDVPFIRSFPAAMKRNWKRLISHEKICGNNYETPLSFMYTSFGLVFKHLSRKHRFRKLSKKFPKASFHKFTNIRVAKEWIDK